MNVAQVAFLASLHLGANPDVCDCDPFQQTVTYKDGSVRQACEIWSRCMGYYRPLSYYNPGKQAEHRDRRMFLEP